MPRRNRRKRPNVPAIKHAIWKRALKDLIAKESDGICHYCMRQTKRNAKDGDALKMTIDHKTPLSRGGRWVKSNLCCCCRECNELKADRTEREFLEGVG